MLRLPLVLLNQFFLQGVTCVHPDCTFVFLLSRTRTRRKARVCCTYLLWLSSEPNCEATLRFHTTYWTI